jgi:hypothetical protein
MQGTALPRMPRRGGGWLLALVVVIVLAAIAAPAEAAAEAVLATVIKVLEIAGIVLASVAGLAALGGMAYGARRLYAWHARNRLDVSRHTPIIQPRSQRLSGARPGAIEAPRKVIPLTVIAEKTARRKERNTP